MSKIAIVSGSAFLLAMSVSSAVAQNTAVGDAAPDVVVLGQRRLEGLDAKSQTGSRLGLSVREIPASIETLTQKDMQTQGLRTSREAFNNVVGAVSGNVPGNPAVLTLRGFSAGAVSILQDGVRVSTSTIVQRDTNTWHFDRIEVIKGPASVMYGEGALAGVVNKITRKPVLGGTHMDALLSVGSFDTVEGAAGVNLKLSDDVAVRADASYMHSSSLYDVADNATRSAGLTASLLFQPSDALSVLLAVDHFADRYDASYQGVPFIPGTVARDASHVLRSSDGFVIDKALRRVSYNPVGAYSGARDTTLRSHIEYGFAEDWKLTNDFMVYNAKRAFFVSGDQLFVPPTSSTPNGRFARSVQRVLHDHEFWSERIAIANEAIVGGLRNRLTLGAEYSRTHFVNPRQQSAVGGSAVVPVGSVDPFHPVVSAFPTDDRVYSASNVIFDSRLQTASIFAEDAVTLSRGWLVLGGVRFDVMDLTRTTTDLNAAGAVARAAPRYRPFSWRVGTTYDVAPSITLYGQYTTAAVPVSSMLVQSIANTSFRMTTGRSIEIGFKGTAFGNRLTATGAAYRIEQRNILTRDPSDPQQSVQGGEQSSQGVELSLSAPVGDHLSLAAGLSYTDANYDALTEAIGGKTFDRSGNRPINTPSTTFLGSVLYDIRSVPLTLGFFVRHASGFYTDTANTYFVRGHSTVDASLSYRISRQATLTVRGRNLTDAFYGEYSGYPSTNVYIGAPRSFELALATSF